MNGRERLIRTVNREEVDRTPIDFWAVDDVYGRLADEMGLADKEAVLRAFGVDLRYYRGPGLVEIRPDAEGVFADHWGVKRKPCTVQGVRQDGTPYTWTYKHLVHSPLAEATSVADIEEYPWPDPSRGNYSGVKDDCAAIRRAGHAVVFGGDRLDRTAQLKAGMYLRGTEQFVMDLVLVPKLAECVLEHVGAYYLEYNRRVFEAAEGMIDVFFMGDDMGAQHSTWVSPELYRKFFFRRFARFNELAHDFGVRTMYHTCGRVTDFVGAFVEAGLDILQSLQPGAMEQDFAAIKREYGERLCFQGGIDIQDVLCNGDRDDVRRHVKDVAEVLGRGGGYIFGTAHNILPDVPSENIHALVDAYHEFGRD